MSVSQGLLNTSNALPATDSMDQVGITARPAQLESLAFFEPTLPAINSYQEFKTLKNFMVWGPIDSNSGLTAFKAFEFQTGAYLNKEHILAQSAGIQGFLFTEKKIRQEQGVQQLIHHLPHYFGYLTDLCSHNENFAQLAEDLEHLELSGLQGKGLYMAVINRVTDYVKCLTEVLMQHDHSSWIKDSTVYQLYPGHFNLVGFRTAHDPHVSITESKHFFADFNLSDWQALQNFHPVDAFWFNGIFEKGSPINQEGQMLYGWSPYAVKDYLKLQPEFGTQQDYNNLVTELKQAGVKIVGDFIFNHTARDAKWLLEDPTLYVHKLASADQEPPEGFFRHVHTDGQEYFIAYGRYRNDDPEQAPLGYAYFRDVAQLDLYNPNTQQKIIATALQMIEQYQFDAARVDMTFSLTKQCFGRLFAKELAEQNRNIAASDCFMTRLINSIRGKYPAFGLIAESYWGYDILSIAGFDAIYGKNSMSASNGTNSHGKHAGFYDALVDQKERDIWSFLQKMQYLTETSFATTYCTFTDNHDEPRLLSVLKGREYLLPGIMLLSALLPTCKIIGAGQENQYHIDRVMRSTLPKRFDQYGVEVLQEPDSKAIPFSGPYQIDWAVNPILLKYSEIINQQLVSMVKASGCDKFIANGQMHNGQFYRLPAFYLGSTEDVTQAHWKVIYNGGQQDLNISISTRASQNLPILIAKGDCVLVDLVQSKYYSAQRIFANLRTDSSQKN